MDTAAAIVALATAEAAGSFQKRTIERRLLPPRHFRVIAHPPACGKPGRRSQDSRPKKSPVKLEPAATEE